MIVKAIVSILQRFLRGCVIYNDWHYIYVLVRIYIYRKLAKQSIPTRCVRILKYLIYTR